MTRNRKRFRPDAHWNQNFDCGIDQLYCPPARISLVPACGPCPFAASASKPTATALSVWREANEPTRKCYICVLTSPLSPTERVAFLNVITSMGIMSWQYNVAASGGAYGYYPLGPPYEENEARRQRELQQMHAALQPNLLPTYAHRLLNAPAYDRPERRVLDVGCGNGDWCRAFADQQPMVDIVGIDMAIPGQSIRYQHNCRLLSRNVLDGLQLPSSSFDVVHVREFALAIPTEYMNWFLTEVYEVLAPGGVLVWIEPRWDCNSNYFRDMRDAVEYCLNMKGLTFASADSLGTVITDSGLFNLVGDMWRAQAVPLRPNGSNEEALAASAVKRLCKALRPLLLEGDYSPKDADTFINRAIDRVQGGQESFTWHYLEAQRR